jgi:hypothetical protein
MRTRCPLSKVFTTPSLLRPEKSRLSVGVQWRETGADFGRREESFDVLRRLRIIDEAHASSRGMIAFEMERVSIECVTGGHHHLL